MDPEFHSHGTAPQRGASSARCAIAVPTGLWPIGQPSLGLAGTGEVGNNPGTTRMDLGNEMN